MSNGNKSNWGGANRPYTSLRLSSAPHKSEGADGDLQIRQTQLGAKLFGKIGGKWYDNPFSVDGTTKIGTNLSDHLSISSSGIDIVKADKKVAFFGSSMRIGEDSTSKSALRVASDGSMSIGIKGANPPNFEVTALGVVTVKGDTFEATSAVYTKLVVDTTTLVVNADAAPDKVGIGTATPETKLEVVADASDAYGATEDLTSGGNTADNIGLIVLNKNASADYSGIRIATRASDSAIWDIINEYQDANDGDLIFRTRNASDTSLEVMRLDQDGNVGIGTASPGTLTSLTLSGTLSLAGDFGDSANIITAFDDTMVNTDNILILMGRDSASYECAVLEYQYNTSDFSKDSFVSLRLTGATGLNVDGSGNVGIGATAPEGILHLEDGNTDQNLVFAGGNTASASNPGFIIESRNDGNTGMEDLTIQGNPVVLQPSSGNVGIGTTSPSTTLHVDATGTAYDATTGLAIFQDNGDRQIAIGGLGLFRRDYDGDDADLRINYIGYNGGTTRFRDLDIYNGKNAILMACDGSTGNVGIGTTAPDKTLEINSGANDNNHIRLAYNDANGSASTYADISCTSGGNLVLAPTGDITINPTGNDVLPNSNYDINLGSDTKQWLSLHAAELKVQTLVAADVLSTIGGRIIIAPTTEIVAALADAGANDVTGETIYVKHNNIASGDILIMQKLHSGTAQFEAIKTVGGAGTAGGSDSTSNTAGNYSYACTRGFGSSGADAWLAGDAVVNTGTTGDGFIDMYADAAVNESDHSGPTIVGNVRTGTTIGAYEPMWAIGNLDGHYGLGNDQYGVGIGKYSGEHLLVQSGSIKFRDNTATKMAITSDEILMYANDGTNVVSKWDDHALYFGADLTAATNIDAINISSGGVQIYGNDQYNFVTVDSDGVTIQADANDKAVISTSGLAIHAGDGSNAVASFGATTYVGLVASEHIKITSSAMDFIDGGTDPDTTMMSLAAGNISMTGQIIITSTGTDNVVIGNADCNDAGTANVVLGIGAGAALESGSLDNILIGTEAGEAMTTGGGNTCIGKDAGITLTTTAFNTCVGFESGKDAETTVGGLYIGHRARASASDVANEGVIAVGSAILYTTGMGTGTLVLGHESLNDIYMNQNGSANILCGIVTLKETTTPTALEDSGKIYTKSDNKLYFQDGGGAEHEVVQLTSSQTLTNKTLTSPVINSPTGDVVTKTGSQTLTNKTLTSPTMTSPALGTPASGTLTNCSFPTLNQNTTGNAATATNAVNTNGTGNLVPNWDSDWFYVIHSDHANYPDDSGTPYGYIKTHGLGSKYCIFHMWYATANDNAGDMYYVGNTFYNYGTEASGSQVGIWAYLSDDNNIVISTGNDFVYASDNGSGGDSIQRYTDGYLRIMAYKTGVASE